MINYSLKGPVSQERQRIRLMAALRESRFPQAILIDGPVGIGKKALAIEIAQALQCSDPNSRPCGHCFGCKMAADAGVTDNWVVPMESKEASARNADDVSAGSTVKTVQDFKQAYITEIFKNPYRIDIFNAATGITVDLIRSMTGAFALKGDRVRVVIIAEADRMNDSAANAFLKTLEEVPPDTYFILTTSSREKMLQTIRSRCLALHLLPLSDEEVKSETIRLLGEDADADAVTDDVVGLAVGSPGKALYYVDHAKAWCELAADFVTLSLSNKYYEIFDKLGEAGIEDAAEANRFLEVLSFLLADLMRKRSGAKLRIPATASLVNLDAFPQVNATALTRALDVVQETMSRVASRRTTPVMLLQSLAIKLFEGYK
ncbi:MAG: AAA family ATPase [Fibrobacter sp.]|nr:AAA family ATPase [Fibrobacter sp.]